MKTKGFLAFSGGIKWECWPEMGKYLMGQAVISQMVLSWPYYNQAGLPLALKDLENFG